jgi:hypothetical protein
VKKIALAALALLGAAFVIPALALPSVEVNLEVLSAALVGECTDGSQTWEVSSQVSVHNTSAETATFESTDFSAKFNRGGGNLGVTDDISVVSSGAFESGAQIEPGATSIFNPVVHVTLPCDVRSANLYAQLTLVGRDKIYSGADEFIEGGTPVPVGPTGILGIAVLLGAAGFLGQQLGRRPRPITSDRQGA